MITSLFLLQMLCYWFVAFLGLLTEVASEDRKQMKIGDKTANCDTEHRTYGTQSLVLKTRAYRL